MAIWTYSFMYPYGLFTTLAKLDKKSIDKPVADEKPRETSGYVQIDHDKKRR
jgi:hypothetical protein